MPLLAAERLWPLADPIAGRKDAVHRIAGGILGLFPHSGVTGPVSTLWRALQRLNSRPTFNHALRRLRAINSQPRSRTLSSARSIAFIVLSPRHADHQRWIGEHRQRGVAVDVLPLAEPFCRADGRVMSFLFTPPADGYDCIAISDGIELFEHSWTYAFLDRLNALAGPGGSIVVPKCRDPGSYLPDSALSELFGSTPFESSGSYLTFQKAADGIKRPQNHAHSSLDAYWPLMERLIFATHDPNLAKIITALGVDHSAPPRPRPKTEIVSLLQKQSYRTCSARTKAAIAEFIVSIYFPGRTDLRLADLGAGTGLNSLEMLLNSGPISAVTLVEPRSTYHWDIAAVYERIRPHLRGPVALVDARGEDYAGPQVDAALICGVLAMLPPPYRQRLISNVWNNLAAGGILMVLENMRRPDPADGERYNEQCYSPAEIDALLGRFAPIRYFMSTAKQELPHRSVVDHTVFRVIQKRY
jgi:phospholipid N-methyltransferase